RRPTSLRRRARRPSERRAPLAARVRGSARTRFALGGSGVARADRRTSRSCGRPVRARRTGGARSTRPCALGRLHATTAPVANAPRARRRAMTVDAAYNEVERLTRRRARNFAYGIMVLPREKRRAIAAIYAFARRVDDIADGTLPEDAKRARLRALRGALSVDPGNDPMLVAL